MAAVTIRPIRGEDFYPALELWNETRQRDPITARFFKRKIFLDVCFDPEGYLLAEADGARRVAVAAEPVGWAAPWVLSPRPCRTENPLCLHGQAHGRQ